MILIVSSYIGRTGRGFRKRFREHIPKKIKNDNHIKSNNARNLTSKDQSYTDFVSNLISLYLCEKEYLHEYIGEV